MRIQNLYYKLGGEKGGFLQTKWIYTKKNG